MAETFRDEEVIKDFLLVTHEAYVAGSVKEIQLPNGYKVGVVEEGSLRMVDTFFESSDQTLFAGEYVIFVEGRPVWHNGYHVNITDPDALRFYFEKVLANPDANLPMVGKTGLEYGQLAYAWWPIGSEGEAQADPVSVGRFVLSETMLDKPSDVITYDGVLNGGWL